MDKICAASHRQFRPPAKKQGHIPNIIEHLFSTHQRPLLLKLIQGSFESISKLFFQSQCTPELQKLMLCAQRGCHHQQLAIFFLLLNVDRTLKEHVMSLELQTNHRKLERFFMDLRHHLVIQFSINENFTVRQFVEQCEEFWVLA